MLDVGLFIPDTYAKETANWQAQALAQDIFDLFLITPLLLIWFLKGLIIKNI